MGTGFLLPTRSLCPLCNHCACQSLCSLSSEPLNVPLCLPAGSKTREGVVQGVASGTSPALAQPLSLPQTESWLIPEGGGGVVEEGTLRLRGYSMGKAGPGSLQGRGHLCFLHPGPQPPPPTFSLL